MNSVLGGLILSKSNALTYRVQQPFLAVRDEPTRPFVFITITEGSNITVVGEVQQSGLVNMLYDGGIVAVFMRDIEARADVVEDTSAQSLVRRDHSRGD